MCSRDHFQNATFDLGTSLNQTFRSMLHLSKISDLGISPPLAKAEASTRKEGTKCSQKPGQAHWLNTKEGQNKAAKESDKGASMNFTSVKRTNISYRFSSLLNPQTCIFWFSSLWSKTNGKLFSRKPNAAKAKKMSTLRLGICRSPMNRSPVSRQKSVGNGGFSTPVWSSLIDTSGKTTHF